MSGQLRAAEPRDVDEILAMVRELAEYEKALDSAVATAEQFHDALFGAMPAVHAIVVEHPHVEDDEERQLAGFALYFLNFSTWLGKHGVYLEDLYVRERFRGSGYGQALLSQLARICIDRGYGRLEWWVLDWNEPALGFYRSIGAVPMDEWTVQRVTGDALTALAALPTADPV